MDEVDIRLATESDRDSVIRIISEIVGEDAPRRYDWLYLQNPHGRALSWLAYSGGSPDPVGITSMFPRKVLVNGRIRIGAIGGDCYVMPAARRCGLATRLHEASFRDMRARGVEFMYGPPAPNNLKALVKAGSTEVATYRRYGRPLTRRAVSSIIEAALPRALRNAFSLRVVAGLSVMPYWFLEYLRLGSIGSDCAIEPVSRFDDGWNEFLDRSARSYPICCLRDPDYLNWRHLQGAPYTRVPYGINRGSKRVGLLILENCRPHMKVVDMLTMANATDTRLALKLAMYLAKEAGCDSISFEAVPATALARRLVRLGFLAREGRGFQVACDSQENQRKFLHNPQLWYFTQSDQDGRQTA